MELRQVVAEFHPPPLDSGSDTGWSLNPKYLVYRGNQAHLATTLPELLPWGLLTQSLDLNEVPRFVLRM